MLEFFKNNNDKKNKKLIEILNVLKENNYLIEFDETDVLEKLNNSESCVIKLYKK